MNGTVKSVIVYLKDGRSIDITGCDPADAIQKLADHLVRPSDIQNTVWTISSPEIERAITERA